MSNVIDGIAYDQYRGYADLDFAALGGVVLRGNANHWRTGQIGARMVLVTPLNHPFLMRGVFQWTPYTHLDNTGTSNQQYVEAKYGSVGHRWAKNVSKRLTLFHFTSQGQDAFTAVANPLTTTTSTGVGWNEADWDGTANPSPFHNPWRMPSVYYVDVVGQSSRNSFNQMGTGGAFAVKNMYCTDYDVLAKGTAANDTTHHNTVGGVFFPDVFDPLWTTNANSASVLPVGGGASDWYIYAQIDDTDYLHFFGAAYPNETGGFSVQSNNFTAHGGYIALIAQPTIVSGLDTTAVSHTYNSQTNYTKAQLIQFLKDRYSNSVSALNTAWSGPKGTPTYTSFDSDGGWRLGSGVADENGRSAHAWFGNQATRHLDSTEWNPGIKTDLDDFLQAMCDQYFGVIKARLAVTAPNLLYKGPSWIGLYGAPARAPILRSVGTYLDLFGWDMEITSDIDPRTSWAMDKIGGPIAIISALYTRAELDSAMYYFGNQGGFATQVQRAAAEDAIVNAVLAAKNISLSVYPWIGYEKWSLYDHVGEKRDWGVMSHKDNPMDGGDYTTPVADPYDATVTVRTEDGVWGNYVAGIKATNIAMRATMVDQFTNPPVPDPPAATAPPLVSIAENFNKTESTVLGPQLSWGETTGDLRIINIFGRTQVTATADNAYGEARATTALQTVNMRVRMLIGQLTAPASGTTRVRVCARFAAAARTYYAFDYSIVANGTITAALLRVVNGSATTLASTTSDTPSVGDTFEVEVQTVAGDMLVTGRRNSVQVLQVTDSDGAKIATGVQAGFGTGNGVGSSAYGAVDDFSAVNLDGDTTPPTAVGAPHVTTALADAVTLAWDAATDATGIDRYQIFRNGTSIADDVTDLFYTDSTVAASTYYKYIIRAFDTTGWATDSAPVRLTTPAATVSDQAGGILGSLVGAL